jgi:ABC-type nitrate/sulfonate/bicarbonate transport system substrate-binding protein
VAGPALTKLLERGDLDAIIKISSLTMAAEAQTDKFRVLFSPNDYWKQKTGYPIVWAAPLVAWRKWVDEDQARAKKFATAVKDSFLWLEKPENLGAAVKSHGPLAGVTSPQDIAEYQAWLTSKNMFMTDWDHKAVDAQWKFLEVAQRTGIIDKVPDESKYALFVEG